MQIAYVTVEGRGRIDDCLAETVALMQSRGLRLAGTVRALPSDHRAHPCDTDIRILPDGPLHRISQPLGQGSRGCRLDAGAIEGIAADVEARLAGCDILVVNKFGKQECLGRGLRPAIIRALDLGIPVIVGVNGLNLQAFLEFVEGLAIRLDALAASVAAWAEGAVASNLAMTEASN
jgi:hypothetical protein